MKPLVITALIWINGILGAVGILIFLSFFTHYHPSSVEISGSIESFNFSIAAAFLLGGCIHLYLTYGLLRVKRWARLVQKIVATPYLLAFPLGTIYALVVFIGLNKREVDTYFSG